jgi:RNA polymerase sigma-70 factor (ECF subfamily)
VSLLHPESYGPMTNDTPSGWSLDTYRPYLGVLAELHLDRRLRGKVDPADVVQEALLRAHQHQNDCRAQNEEERTGWLRRILVNTLLETSRRYHAEQRDVARERSLEESVRQSSERLEAWLQDGQSSPSARAERNEELVRLSSAMMRLPNDQRQALQLRYVNGLSVGEVAKQL